MAVLAWGKPDLYVRKIGWNPDGSRKFYKVRHLQNPKEDSTNLETAEGDKTEAKGEGGAIVDVKKKKSNYSLKFDQFIKKGTPKSFGDEDGIVPGDYEVWYLPEDKECPGLYFPQGTFGVTTAATSADGITQSISFDASEKVVDGVAMKQMYLGVINEENLLKLTEEFDVDNTEHIVLVAEETDEEVTETEPIG